MNRANDIRLRNTVHMPYVPWNSWFWIHISPVPNHVESYLVYQTEKFCCLNPYQYPFIGLDNTLMLIHTHPKTIGIHIYCLNMIIWYNVHLSGRPLKNYVHFKSSTISMGLFTAQHRTLLRRRLMLVLVVFQPGHATRAHGWRVTYPLSLLCFPPHQTLHVPWIVSTNLHIVICSFTP